MTTMTTTMTITNIAGVDSVDGCEVCSEAVVGSGAAIELKRGVRVTVIL